MNIFIYMKMFYDDEVSDGDAMNRRCCYGKIGIEKKKKQNGT